MLPLAGSTAAMLRTTLMVLWTEVAERLAETKGSCMRTTRTECSHIVDHAHGLSGVVLLKNRRTLDGRGLNAAALWVTQRVSELTLKL